jgi:hypothetical protein
VSERVLDSSDERRTLVLVVALRVLRDPVLALDTSNEALATQSAARMTWPPLNASGGSPRWLDATVASRRSSAVGTERGSTSCR